MIIYNNQPGVINGTLGNGFTLDIGVTAVTEAVGDQLAATPGLVMHLKTDTFRGIATTYNVLAESTGGDPNNVVMAGAPPRFGQRRSGYPGQRLRFSGHP